MDVRSASISPRLRILALHGRGSHSDVTRIQLHNLGLSPAEYDIVYLNGPFDTSNPGPGIEALGDLVSGPWHSWLPGADRSPGTGRTDGLLSALVHVLDTVETQGPFDAVFAFSQACPVACLANDAASDATLRAALEACAGRDFDHVLDRGLPFPSAIYACAAASDVLADMRQSVADSAPHVPYSSLHLIGRDDAMRSASEAFASAFDGAHAQVVYLPGGHEIRPLGEADAHVVDALRACLSARDSVPDVSPALAAPLNWQPSSPRSAFAVDATRQLTAIRLGVDDVPDTIVGMLAAQPAEAPLLRRAGERDASVCTTYGQMLAFCAPGGEGDLRRIGVMPGEVVAYLASPGGSATAAAAFLSMAAQTCAVPFSASMTESDARIALEQYGVKHMVVFMNVAAPGVRAAFEQRELDGEARLHYAEEAGASRPGLFRFLDPVEYAQTLTPLANPAEAHALLLRTSGTTALPKVVPLRQRDLLINAAILADGIGITASDVTYSVMPLDHIGGLSASILASVAVGAAISCDGAYTPEGMVAALSEADPKPTWYSAVPTIHNATVRHLHEQALVDAHGVWHGHGLRLIRSGAAALKEPDRVRLETAFSCEVVATYSMSEQMPIAQPPRTAEGWHQHPGAVGAPVVAAFAIVDPVTFQPLPFGVEGEVALCGPTVFPGYLDNPEANRSARFLMKSLDGGRFARWFLTGDLGIIDPDGTLALRGRLKELIKRGGEQVAPVEIETALAQHPWVRTSVCFPVPSEVYGEEVGCALVLDAARAGAPSQGEAQREMRDFLRKQGLANHKIPSHLRLVDDDVLPKTASNKYIRKGLAELLGIGAVSDSGGGAASSASPPAAPSDKPLLDWQTLSGFRFVLACYVMFMHIGSDASWGAVSNLRQFPWHVHAFFAVAGFSLAASMPALIARKGGFIWARISGMYPLYGLALLLALINLLPGCQPSTFDPIFHWNSQPGDAGRLFCEGTPLIQDSWLGNLFSTLVIYLTGLSATPLWTGAWFMGFYLWFISMYFQCLVVFPWLYNALLKQRGNTRRLLALTGLGLVLNLVIVLGFWFGYAVDVQGFGMFDPLTGLQTTPSAAQVASGGQENAIVLGFYLFAPFWMVYFVVGMCAAFLYDAVRPAEQRRARRWGHVADTITVAMVLVSIAHVAQGYFPHGHGVSQVATDGFFMRPEAADSFADPAVANRIWDNIYARLFAPLTLLWLFALSTGQGVTARLLRARPLTVVLAPAAYGCFLFHQIIGQWYYAITRGGDWWNWWSYRKAFYWFSPQPVPVEWYEYFYVVGLVVLFSKLVEPLEPAIRRGFATVAGWVRGGVGVRQDPAQDVLGTILGLIQRETGTEAKAEWTLDDCGLASLGVVRFTASLESAFSSASRKVKLSAADVMAARDIREIAALVEAAMPADAVQAPMLQPT